ncbi:MAG: [FeFe] hydrogenase H-cluster maturation GTPase HydF [Candidatus Cloacimonadales bacterium]|jgi:[FeFe] hydrogenase H-cluster maturation GTPase HydF|nr:[FeFe] hydrogenase H-cluster maturation GTPase HydF [Candidatus Cloacimonadota bacterium]MDD2649948.1 [FeFe] hydrogenase H-cluster maturation GTPase HydF [Candidatus Cloacimonadota bacterium]MDD3501134.1 [FeFe] hydrogenase H-cluster maturation GTPase HydF [Candidatus Cloacimonadota bacterium]MDX9977869.1 [FeFe] hydrogenase H-cluster maturation GTPase HydF [Candidatus Cloacimonadales bacterium]
MTNKGDRVNICIIGKTNVGKSSLINAIIGQNISIVSEQAGTTTDSVTKVFELVPVGPVTFHDTAGYDDQSDLGKLRVKATYRSMWRSDIVIILLDERGAKDIDLKFIAEVKTKKVPYIIVQNKADLQKTAHQINSDELLYVSTKDKESIDILKEKMISKISSIYEQRPSITEGLIKQNNVVLLSIPIDKSAPKGRLILPQVQVLREILDLNAVAICTQPQEIESLLKKINNQVDLVITDSQCVELINKIVPEPIKLTTFSILFANYKGELDIMLNGLDTLAKLKDGDKVLIAEACSHHTQCNDIGRQQIPALIKKFSQKDFEFAFASAYDFPEDLDTYKLVIHCGGCMISHREMKRRIIECQRMNVPITNYGLMFSKTQGVLDRAVQIFK